MVVIQTWLVIFILFCFYEWDHLKRDNIRHNELWFFYAGIFLIMIWIITLFFETEDIHKLF